MEAAAEKIRQLSKNLLPELPHQLSLDYSWRCRTLPPPDRCEEWHVRPLQYMTNISVPDRGVLLTRGYADLRPDPEPPKPLPKEVHALAKSGGEKKKLSLSDYKNKKSSATSSASPPDSNLTPNSKKEPAATSAFTKTIKQPKEARISEGTKLSNHEGRDTARTPSFQSDGIRESRLPPKPASLPPRPPTPEASKKRAADADDSPRPSKRTKPLETARPIDTKSQIARDEVRRRHVSSPQDLLRGSKAGNSSLLNGRSLLSRNASSPPQSRGEAVNGGRPPATDNMRVSSARRDVSSKAYVPPLLSPLRFDTKSSGDHGLVKNEKRRRDEGNDGARPSLPSKTETTASKKPKAPTQLPPLLSPTLPPDIEDELGRTKTAPSKLQLEEANPLSRIVVIRIPKSQRKSFKRILALPTSRKEPSAPTAPSGLSQPVLSKKRPAGSQDKEMESLAVKKPRVSDIAPSRALPMPSTPSKKGATAMSRVSSNNSAAVTPGDAVTATPSRLASAEHHVNGDLKDPTEMAKINKLKEKEVSLLSLGKRLKRNGDAALNRRNDPSLANGNHRIPETSVIQGYLSITESIVAFMSAFHSQATYRTMQGKTLDPTTWNSLFPLLDFLRKDMLRYESKRIQPIFGLLHVIQGVAYDQMIRCYVFCDERMAASLPDVLAQERRRAKAWPLVRDIYEHVDASLQVDLRPWTPVEDFIDQALRIMRRWCTEENIDWTPEIPSR